ncbi:glycerophosphodiester phosphodiesterase [Myroides odoratimimus]|uniref:GP-PDE domain-containing protein n=1 Tax=Myroides odoratimimus CIP 101113 TaxID=883154 RepID=A0AAV3EZK2_9FLAO|nr:glycerophosphodiester phosphodiesterase family protein [Myroides odoratimimus]EHO06055.1 hypothetical protein HMPREF9715_03152 [Myroides odoratimimus CIP 101113]
MRFQKRLLVLCLAMSSFAFAQDNKVLRIAHRGAMGHVTENTVESVLKAVEMKSDAIEIDVFKVKDGALMVHHDDTLERLTNGKGNIEQYTQAELQALLVDGKYKMPTLEDIITAINRKAVLNIELKGANTAEGTYAIIQQFKQKGWTNADFIISSFKWDELEKIAALDPNLDIAVLTSKEPADAIEFAHKIKAVAINPYFKTLNEKNVSKIKQAKLKIYPYTANEEKDIQRLKDLKVDGIITNFPERI